MAEWRDKNGALCVGLYIEPLPDETTEPLPDETTETESASLEAEKPKRTKRAKAE